MELCAKNVVKKGGSQTKWKEGDDDGATRCFGTDKTLREEILQVMKSQGGTEKEG